MWFFMPEINEWRLLFASPEVLVEGRGSRVLYEQIHEARKALGPLTEHVPLSAIGVSRTNDELVRSLRVTVVVTGPGVSRVRFSKNVANGHMAIRNKEAKRTPYRIRAEDRRKQLVASTARAAIRSPCHKK